MGVPLRISVTFTGDFANLLVIHPEHGSNAINDWNWKATLAAGPRSYTIVERHRGPEWLSDWMTVSNSRRPLTDNFQFDSLLDIDRIQTYEANTDYAVDRTFFVRHSVCRGATGE
jgi:hypothetical protein